HRSRITRQQSERNCHMPAVKQTPKIGEGKPGPGRPKGKPNRTTALLKDAILQAATEAGRAGGLVGYLKAQAEANPQSYLPLLGKVLPLQVVGDAENPVTVHVIERRIVRSNPGN